MMGPHHDGVIRSPSCAHTALFRDRRRLTTGKWHPLQHLGRLEIGDQEELPIRREASARPGVLSAPKWHGLQLG